MRLPIPEYYPWGEPTNYVPKIYAGLPPRAQKHYWFGVIKQLDYWPEEYDRTKYGYKYFHLVEWSEYAEETYNCGTKIHFTVQRNNYNIRFCGPVVLLFVQDIEVLWENGEIFIYVDGLELMNKSLEYFVKEGGFPNLHTFKRLYPRDFKGLSLHWEYQVL